MGTKLTLGNDGSHGSRRDGVSTPDQKFMATSLMVYCQRFNSEAPNRLHAGRILPTKMERAHA